MMNDSIRELIDSCRPQGDDLSQAEMRPLADLIAADIGVSRQLERSRQLDDTITDAVQDVPTPAGLQQRLLASLANSAAVSTDKQPVSLGPSLADGLDLQAGGTRGDESGVVPPRKPGDAWTWRLWVPIVTSAAVLAVIVFTVSQRSGSEISYQELVSAALSWEANEEDWVNGNVIWTSHPLPKAIRAESVAGRQRYSLPRYKVMARCYDLKLKEGGTARVFVFANTPGFVLPGAPPAKPMFTLGKCVAAWTSGGLVYVLVVDGTEEAYNRSIRPASPIAFRRIVNDTLCPIGTV
ncbi:MAG: hypothetical protein CMJ50_01080 [Planctomycetaceae bacterium]|nr:hypothetical protein [Planctomycetaceae bacterium]